MITVEEFAKKIKSKYPQYKDIDDLELVNRTLEMYPQYKEQFKDEDWQQPEQPKEQLPYQDTPMPQDPEQLHQSFLAGKFKSTTPLRMAKTFTHDLVTMGSGMARAAGGIGTTDKMVREKLWGSIGIPKGASQFFDPVDKVIEDIGFKSADFIDKYNDKYLGVEDRTFLDDFAGGIGSLAGFVTGGKTAQYGLKALKFAPKIAALTGQSVHVVMEAMVEAGFIIKEQEDKGVSREEAVKSGLKGFAANVPLIMLTNKYLYSKRKLGKGLPIAFKEGFKQEATQEGAQEIISKLAQGEWPNLVEAIYSAVLGGLTGGGASSIQQGIANIQAEGQRKRLEHTQEQQAQEVGMLQEAQELGMLEEARMEGLPEVTEQPHIELPIPPMEGIEEFIPKELNESGRANIIKTAEVDPVSALRMAVQPASWPGVKQFAENVAIELEQRQDIPQEQKAELAKSIILAKLNDVMGVKPLEEIQEEALPETLPESTPEPIQEEIPEISEKEIKEFKEMPLEEAVDKVLKDDENIPIQEIVEAKKELSEEPIEEPVEEFEDEDFDIRIEPELEKKHPLSKEEFKKRFPEASEEVLRSMVKSQMRVSEIPKEVIKEHIGVEEEIWGEIEEEEKVKEGTPVMDLLVSGGYLNKESYKKHWGGELPEDDFKYYFRKQGGMSLSDLAERAAGEGLIPVDEHGKYDEHDLIEVLNREMGIKKGVKEEGAEYNVFEPAKEVKADPLIQEARKYKTAEAFVESQTRGKEVVEQEKKVLSNIPKEFSKRLSIDDKKKIDETTDYNDIIAVKIITSELRKLGWVDSKRTSFTGKRKSSVYYQKGNAKIRLSDHKLPMHAQRQFYQGELRTWWNQELITNKHTIKQNLNEIVNKIENERKLTESEALDKELQKTISPKAKEGIGFEKQKPYKNTFSLDKAKEYRKNGLRVFGIENDINAFPIRYDSQLKKYDKFIKASDFIEPKKIYKEIESKEYKKQQSKQQLTDIWRKAQEGVKEGGEGYAPIYFSKLQKTIKDKMPNNATVEQIKGIIRDEKKEEIEWSGINEFLEGKDKINKQELLDYLKANEVQIEEVTKEIDTPKQKPLTPEEYDRYRYLDARFLDLTHDEKREWEDFSVRINPSIFTTDTTKFSQWQLKGAKTNYKELLLTLDKKITSEYKSPHFEEPNILAHVRFNDRTVSDKKMLFIEEIQSDWHQKGRKEGYKDDTPIVLKRIEEIEKERTSIVSKMRIEERDWNIEQRTIHQDPKTKTYEALRARLKDINQEQSDMEQRDRAPDAPFKKNWHELALKRMLRYASENNYDMIGWTTGEQQAERYGLSKQVDKIETQRWEKDAYLVITYKDNREIDKRTLSDKGMEEFIGKDLAKKIIEEKEDIKTWQGLDLKVGGEGMKGFYDTMIPSFLNKFTKKWGGKVGDVKLGIKKIHSLIITPELKKTAVDVGFPLFEPTKQYQKSEEDVFPEGSKKAMDDVVKNIKKSIKPVGQWHDLRLKKVVDKIKKDWIDKGTTDFIGQEIETIQDVAEIAAVFRHPSIEHFQVMGLKGGKYLNSTIITSGKISRVYITLSEIIDIVKKMGCDEFYVSHNHPSGDPYPSEEDVGMTKSISNIKGFKGHIVTDGKQFSFIKDNKATLYEYKREKPAFRKKAEAITGPNDIVENVKGVLNGDMLGIVFVDTKNQILSIDHVDPLSDYNKYVKTKSKKYGATRAIIITGDTGFSKLKATTFKGNYLDFIVLSNDGTYKSTSLEQVKGFNLVKETTEEGVFEVGVGEEPMKYDTAKVSQRLGRIKIGQELTLRVAITSKALKKGRIPRGQKVKVISIDKTNQDILIEKDGEFIAVPAEVFAETYVKPVSAVIPGKPIKTAIQQQLRIKEKEKFGGGEQEPKPVKTGIKDISPEVSTTQSKSLVKKLRAEAKGARNADRVARMEVKADLTEKFKSEKVSEAEIKKDIIQYAKDNLPANIRGKYLNALSNAKNKRQMALVTARMDRDADNAHRKSVIEDIKKMTKRALEASNIDIDYKDRIKSLFSDIEIQGHRKETTKRWFDTFRYFLNQQQQGKDVKIPIDVMNEIQILAMTPIKYVKIEKLENIYQQLIAYAELGKLKLASKKNVLQIMKDKVIKDLVDEVIPFKHSEMPILHDFIDWKGELYQDMLLMDRVMDFVGGNKATYDTAHNKLKDDLDGNYSLYWRMKDEYIYPLVDKIKKLNLSRDSMERIGIYAAKVQENGLERVLQGRPDLTREYVEKLKLEGVELEIYNDMRKVMDETYPLVKKLIRKLYNRDMGSVADYFAFMMDWDKLNSLDVFERLSMDKDTSLRMTKDIHKGFSKQRKKGAKTPIQINAFDIFRKHMDDVCYLLAMQEKVKFYSEIFNSEEYREAAGPEVAIRMLTYMDLLAKKGGTDFNDKVPAVDWIRTNITHGMLGFKISSMAIQVTALGDASALIGGRYVLKGLNDVVTSSKVRKWLIDNSPELKNRIGDDIAFIELSDTEWLKKCQKMGLLPMQLLDRFAASAALLGAYNKELDKKGKKFDFERVDEDAMVTANKMMRLTQSTGNWKDQAVIFNRGHVGGRRVFIGNKSLNKAVFHFQSFMLTRFGTASYDLPRAKTDAMVWGYIMLAGTAMAETGIRTGVRAAILGALGVAGYGLGQSLYDEDDDFWLDSMMNMLDTIPFLSNIYRPLMYKSAPTPTLDSITKTVYGISDFTKAETEYKKVKGLTLAIKSLGIIAGISGSAQVAQLWNYSLSRKTLFFPWKKELKKLKDISYDDRTENERQRFTQLNQAKIKVNAINRRYKVYMENGYTDKAKAEVEKVIEIYKDLK